MILENVNLSSDKMGRPPLWSNETDSDFCHQSPTYTVSSVYFNHALISYVHWTNKCLISVRNLHDLPFMLWIEFGTCQSTNLKRRWLDLFCNYYHIQCVCNHSTALVVIFCCCNLSFCHMFGTSKILSLTYTLPLTAISTMLRSKFAALSPVMGTEAEKLFRRQKTIKQLSTIRFVPLYQFLHLYNCHSR
jgi:hypothetical protein